MSTYTTVSGDPAVSEYITTRPSSASVASFEAYNEVSGPVVETPVIAKPAYDFRSRFIIVLIIMLVLSWIIIILFALIPAFNTDALGTLYCVLCTAGVMVFVVGGYYYYMRYY